jgi:hypothetical protein
LPLRLPAFCPGVWVWLGVPVCPVFGGFCASIEPAVITNRVAIAEYVFFISSVSFLTLPCKVHRRGHLRIVCKYGSSTATDDVRRARAALWRSTPRNSRGAQPTDGPCLMARKSCAPPTSTLQGLRRPSLHLGRK